MTTHQPRLLSDAAAPPGPVTCLGRTFADDAERRAHFSDLLRQKLQDPAFRAIEGFPIGSDEAILALSDPPYYTACPNPWLADFVAEWEGIRNDELGIRNEEARSAIPNSSFLIPNYHREPFAADVSEGKNDPIYNAHSYHTKVPHKAIMRYILHYTEPGDVVFDGFCGTGMTGVAAQLCGDRAAVEALGYRVDDDGAIHRPTTGPDGKAGWQAFARLGARRAVLNDLSPAATFIAYNYNTPVDVAAFEGEARRILAEVEAACGWMYETRHSDGQTGTINYTVWSDVFVCPTCAGEVVFLDEALDTVERRVKDDFNCPNCNTLLTKRSMERMRESYFDALLSQPHERIKRHPVLIAYQLGRERYEKKPDKNDMMVLDRIDALPLPSGFPNVAFPFDDMWEAPRMRNRGITHVHHMFLPRSVHLIDAIWRRIELVSDFRIQQFLKFWMDQSLWGFSILNRYRLRAYSHVNQYMSGVYYVPSQIAESNAKYNLSGKMERLPKAFSYKADSRNYGLSTNSCTSLPVADNSLDYIFIDPPFGDNFAYSELNFIVESWLDVRTQSDPEAVVDRAKKNRSKQKGLPEYLSLMRLCLVEAHRVLKPGHWITVEFSNTSASVWNAIQTALTEAGFIVANVSALDKQQGSFKAVTTPTAVKQDLVISAYKPNGGFTERFPAEAATEAGVWDFVRTHLRYLPVAKEQAGTLQGAAERDPRLLYDQLVATYVRHGYPVPLGSSEFQAGLRQRFSERDGYYFLPEQAVDYDRRRLLAREVAQPALFVADEASAIAWLRQQLRAKPQIFADLNPLFMQQLGGWRKSETQLDLRELLEENFLRYDGQGPVPEPVHAYLSSNYKDLRNLAKDDPALRAKGQDRWYAPDPNRAADLERLRERHLLREFETYRDSKQRKLKLFRLEAMRAGFKRAWQARDYATILAVAKKIPDDVLHEDPKLLMWLNGATTRLEQAGG